MLNKGLSYLHQFEIIGIMDWGIFLKIQFQDNRHLKLN